MQTDPNNLREIPAPANARHSCSSCGRPIIWAITVASPNGRGGKLMPLDPLEDSAGNVAITQPHGRGSRLHARVLMKDEARDRSGTQWIAMPHFATCAGKTKPELPDNVIDMAAHRRRRRGGRR
ncbi:hypothetical protein Back2_18130 [Nocardioides baekrokdamisoli]|uniref:Uncharacterized protein n=1 Tax=Nocardioides baekrokdamisoli TaxID=1804624 RepID=A0A3G9IGQ4_9ACTN|nr:hypothetical protein [Nocardioides baekrokdamisoli]BBH17526.1 hypothetical protein Back2_18130 [Nocardioides baekrokdamisoli]